MILAGIAERNEVVVDGRNGLGGRNISPLPRPTSLSHQRHGHAHVGDRDDRSARRALREAGYNGETIVLIGPDGLPDDEGRHHVSADILCQAGMTVDYQALDLGHGGTAARQQERPDRGGWNMFCTNFSGDDLFTPATNLALRGNGARAWPG